MDKYEKEYFESLRSNAKPFEGNLHEIAKERLKLFAAMITRLVEDEKENFDLIVGPGNSGIYMTTLTKMVYEELGIAVPKIVNIPIVRILEGGDKLVDIAHPEKIEVPDGVKNVLFVDDEIMRAGTAKICFELIIKNQSRKQMDAVIVAENHFFEWHYKIPGVSVRFFAYARLIQWINGIMGHLLSDDLFQEIDVIVEIETYNDALAVILGGALKKDGTPPYYDFEAEKIMREKVNDYDSKKDQLINEVKALIKQGIEEYRKGETEFRF